MHRPTDRANTERRTDEAGDPKSVAASFTDPHTPNGQDALAKYRKTTDDVHMSELVRKLYEDQEDHSICADDNKCTTLVVYRPPLDVTYPSMHMRPSSVSMLQMEWAMWRIFDATDPNGFSLMNSGHNGVAHGDGVFVVFENYLDE